MIDAQIRHDLLNALNQIIGYTEMLAEEAGSGEQDKLCDDLGMIHCAAHGMAKRLETLFSGSRSDCSAAVCRPCSAKVPAPAETMAGEPVEPTPLNHTGRILIVDDDANNRALLSRLLQRQGYCIATAENGADALACLYAEAFDLVLLDVIMPEMNGFAVLGRLQADKALRQIPVIMISACAEMEQVVRCIELGADDYLPKPFNSTLLKARISASLEKKRLREQEMHLISQAMQAEAALERHRSLSQAVAGVAHEINTPLGIVRTAQSVIQNRLAQPTIRRLFAADSEREEIWQEILEASALLNKNIDAAHRLIESFKKIAVDQLVEQNQTVDLPAVIDDAVDLFKLSARQAKLEISVDVSGIRGTREWHGYPGHIAQIVLNFLQNIERYAYPEGRGGKVEIVVSDGVSPQSHVETFLLTVRDHGAGIPREHLGKIFDPFFTTGRGRGGTGLGLAIVHNTATLAMRGSLSVDSDLGEGSCFTVVFPKR